LQPEGASPPVRKDTSSSISTAATAMTSATLVTDETPGTPYSVASSPSYPAQAVFSAKDGSDVGPQRRASRRRTGPLTAVQRERAHLIRKMGACPDCRRRRVAVSPTPLVLPTAPRRANLRTHTLVVPPEPSQHDVGGSCETVQISPILAANAWVHGWATTQSGATALESSIHARPSGNGHRHLSFAATRPAGPE
jgi:hypothetical protein